MREIKFRAWNKDGRYWLTDPTSPWGGINSAIHHIQDNYELMQYTGLKDKNGKEIYEGDIVKIGNDLIEEVKWVGVGDWMEDKQPMVGFVSHGTIYKGKPIEVIGNIYENKDLLV